MSNIRTIEDGFQYRIHHILKTFKNDYDADIASGFINENMDFEGYMAYRKSEFADAVLNDIDTYCGLDEAVENAY